MITHSVYELQDMKHVFKESYNIESTLRNQISKTWHNDAPQSLREESLYHRWQA